MFILQCFHRSYCLSTNVPLFLLFIHQCFFFFIVCPQLSLFVLVVNQCLFLLFIFYPLMSPFYCYCLSTNVSFGFGCSPMSSSLIIVYSPMSPSWCCLSPIVSFGFGCSPISSSFIYCLSTCPMSSFGFVDPPMSLGFSCSPMSPFCYCMSTNVSS